MPLPSRVLVLAQEFVIRTAPDMSVGFGHVVSSAIPSIQNLQLLVGVTDVIIALTEVLVVADRFSLECCIQ